MSTPESPIPVILPAYARPAHLRRVLDCLRANRVPLIHAFADGARRPADVGRVAEVRALLRGVDWCELKLVERPDNLGLGRNVMAAIGAVAAAHEAFIVWEDDLIAVPGTYDWLCAALRHYRSDSRVMSVSAWNHARVTPPGVGDQPYFDGRADCWVWGSWSRAWAGMADEDASAKLRAAARRGVAATAYGHDLPRQAAAEHRRNIWAVRWLAHHLEHGGLCLRPPWSMVEHIGFGEMASNAGDAIDWANPALRPAPPVPAQFPAAVEDPRCRALWQQASPHVGLAARARTKLRRMARALLPAATRGWLRRQFGPQMFRGDYATWAAASARATGYDTDHILEKAVTAARAVRSGQAVWERDTVLFYEEASHAPLLRALQAAAARDGKLSVLDFGGALGSTWWQHRRWLADVPGLRWSVVEQPGFVAAGRREFATDVLRFYETIDACFAAEKPTLILLSSVLPYLEQPHVLLADLAARDCAWLVIDRTGFTRHGRDQLTVQHVPEAIYRATYPCWFFDQAKLVAPLQPRWAVVDEWRSFDNGGEKFEYRGLLLQRTGPAAHPRT